ncbi:MAG TPA: hypothetical protein ENJ90_12405 [Devosia sp.]|nr:hypothetical protein [Devosia sp.]
MTKSGNIKLLSFAKFQALLMALLGIVAGAIYSFGGAFYDLVSTGSLNAGSGLAFFALVGMPIAFGLFGFVLGLVEAVLFNLSPRWFGEIELDFERRVSPENRV